MATKMPRLFKWLERVATETETIPEAMRTGEVRRLDFILLQPNVVRIEGWKTVTESAEVQTAKYIWKLSGKLARFRKGVFLQRLLRVVSSP